jgi:hypothetical protein
MIFSKFNPQKQRSIVRRIKGKDNIRLSKSSVGKCPGKKLLSEVSRGTDASPGVASLIKPGPGF